MIDYNFWRDKSVFVTGHTGFKGSWLVMWLVELGAKVTGFALPPTTDPSLYKMCRIEELLAANYNEDIRDLSAVVTAMKKASPDIVIHMAAQPLVRESYKYPVDTFSTNIMGTVHVLEAVRQCPSVKAVVNVTTDKCYENKEWLWGYRENEVLGGHDPYSNSKACSELVTAAYRNSFFIHDQTVTVATARAGNVIGGGDWSEDRLIPDCIRSLLTGNSIKVRNPDAIRPWQHVLEPLRGYLMLAERMYEKGERFGSAWNFGPVDSDVKPVKWVVERICEQWQNGATYEVDAGLKLHEATYLKLDCSKAAAELEWKPVWSLDAAIEQIVSWTKAYVAEQDMRKVSLQQIRAYTAFGGVSNE